MIKALSFLMIGLKENRSAIILPIVLLLPIFSVRYFTNNDGSGHLYIAYVMRQLLAGNDLFTRYFEFNSIALPNSTGHWMIAGLLGVASPEIVTKLMLAITFLAFFSSALYLRYQIRGGQCKTLATMFAALLALNWFWFQGGYNQTLGSAGFAFGLALVYRWRAAFTFRRVAALSFITLLVYFSHLVSFVLLAGGVLLLSAWQERNAAKRALPAAAVAILPTIPLFLVHILNGSQKGEPFVPHWRGIEGWFDLAGWFRYLVAADPFALASRKSLPFTDSQSALFVILAPFAVILAAATLLAVGTAVSFWRSDSSERRKMFPLLILALGLFAAAAFGPGDFGIANGSVLRERFLIAGLTLFLAVFDAGSVSLLRKTAGAALALGILMQFCYLIEYAVYSDRQTREFVAVRQAIEPGNSIASIIVSPRAGKFRCLPATQISSFLGVNRNVIVWDNYELGHYLFPVIVRDAVDKDFAFRLSSSAVFGPEDRFKTYDENFAIMTGVIRNEHERIDRFVFFGKDERIESLLGDYYSVSAVSPTGAVRIFARKTF